MGLSSLVALENGTGHRWSSFLNPSVLGVYPQACAIAIATLFAMCGAHAQVSVGDGGTPSYSKAINVPPGVAGMSPKLGLLYSGGGVNGPVGYGWSVQGISTITRCPSSRAVDGAVSVVTYGPNDKLCLDGQRLIQVDPSTGNVINATNTAPSRSNPFQTGDAIGQSSTGFIEFKTEKDTYARIRAYGAATSNLNAGPAYFRVWTKSGQVYEYGSGPASDPVTSNALILQTSQGSANAVAIAWPVARISDTVGNYIDFRYEQRDIAWGSGASSPSSPVLGHEWNLIEVDYSGNKVIFNYVDRTDSTILPRDSGEAYHQGYKNVSRRLLQSVTTYVNSPYAAGTLGKGTNAVAVSTVKLTYSMGQITGRNRVSKIQDCSGDGSAGKCLPATTFNYADGGNDGYTSIAAFQSSGLNQLQMTASSSGSYGVLTGDFNGDGRTDILRWSNTPSGNQLWLSNGDGTFTQSSTGTPSGSSVNVTSINLFTSDSCHYSIAADFNGDGITDILNIARTTTPSGATCAGGANTLYISNGDGTFKPVTVPANISFAQSTSTRFTYTNCLQPVSATYIRNCSEPGDTILGYSQSAGANFYILDVNGDGIPDIVTTIIPTYAMTLTPPTPSAQCASITCSHVYIGNGDGTFTEQTATNIANQSVYSDPSLMLNYLFRAPNTGDYNGDGLTDLYTTYGIWVSTGDGNFTSPSAYGSGCTYPIDFNGDGRTDCLVIYGTSNQQLNIGGGTGATGNFNLTAATYPLQTFNASGAVSSGVSVLDVNGDGRQDILVWADTAANNKLYISNGDGTYTPSTTFNLGGGSAVQLQSADGTSSYVLGDYTGHGQLEMLRIQTSSAGTTNNLLYVKSDQTPVDQLKSVVTGTGATTSLYYVPLANSVPNNGISTALGARYVNDRGTSAQAVYPTIDVSAPMYLVATSVADSGVGNNVVLTEYSYKGLKADSTGRGFLGFREILRQTVGADGSPMTVDTQFLQSFPYIGVASISSTFWGALNATGSSLQLSQTSNVYCDQTSTAAASSATPSAPCPVPSSMSYIKRPYLYQTTETGKDLGGNTLPTVVTQNAFDGGGNPLSILATTTDTAGLQYSKVTNNAYFPDNTSCTDYQTCSWIRGRLSQATVSNTTRNLIASMSATLSAGTAANASAISGSGALQGAVMTPSLNFGSLQVGSSSQLTVTLDNDGAKVLSLTVPSATSVSGTDFSFVSTTCTTSLAAAATCNIVVQFTPSGAAARSGTLSVSTGAGVLTTTLSGTGLQSILSFNPASLAFGTQQTGGSYGSSVVTLTNSGNETATALSFSVPAGYSMMSSTCGTNLANGNSCSFTVVWSPTAAQAYSGALSATTSNGVASSVTIAGTGQNPSATITNFNAGGIQVGSSNTTGNVTVTNTGVGPLTIGALSTSTVTGSGWTWQNSGTQCSGTLTAGASCVVYPIFTPPSIGTFNGTVTVNAGAAGTLTGALTGVGLQSQLSFSSTSLAFGTQQTGGSYASGSVTLTNNGNETATSVAFSVPGGFSMSSSNCGSTLNSGAVCSFTVSWNPTAAQAYGGTLSASTANGTVGNSITLSGTGQAPSATLSGASFGNVQVGQGASQTVTLQNTGVGPISVTVPSSASVSGSGFSFSSTTCLTSLAAGATCTVSVNYNPTSMGAASGTVTLSTGAGTKTGSLSGTGLQSQLSFSTTNLSFGSQQIGGSYNSGAVTLTNNGNETATSVAFSVPSGFSMTSSNCGSTLNSGAVCSFTVSWNPTAAQAYGGTLSASASNGVVSNNISLSGTSLQSQLSFSATNLAYGTQQTGGSYASGAVTLTNNGNETATSVAFSVPSGFSMTSSNCGSTLNSGAVCSFTVSWNPTAAQAYGGTLSASTANGTVGNSITLSGTGQAPSATLSGASFGNVQVGQGASQTVTLQNTGVGPISVTVPSSASVSGSGFSFSSTTCSTSLAAGATCTVSINYNPTTMGAASGTVTIATSAGTKSGSLSGTGVQSQLSVSAPNLYFGLHLINSSYASSTVTLSNNGNETATSLVFNVPSGFSVTSNNCGSSLSSGNFCFFTVTWSPTVAQAYSGTLSISTSDGIGSTVSLSGTAYAIPVVTIATLSPASVRPSGVTNLGWQTANATSVTASCAAPATGSYSGGNVVGGVSITAGSSVGSDVCTITASNAGGSGTPVTVTLQVVNIVPLTSGNATPAPNLVWTYTNPNSVAVTPTAIGINGTGDWPSFATLTSNGSCKVGTAIAAGGSCTVAVTALTPDCKPDNYTVYTNVTISAGNDQSTTVGRSSSANICP